MIYFLSAVAAVPVVKVMRDMIDPLLLAGVLSIQQSSCLCSIVPAETPCVLPCSRLALSREVRDIFLLALIKVALIACSHIQPVSSIHTVIEP